MPTENPRVLKNLINKYISPLIVEDRLVINEWDSYTGVHPEPGVIILDEKPHDTMRLGDIWKVGYDDTRFFEAEITVPDSFAGRKCYLTIDFGGEAIVRVNDKIVGAVSSRANSGWVGREEILFDKPFEGGEKLFIQIEAAVDCGGFCDAAMDGAQYMTYTMAKSELQLINEDAEALYFDMTTAWDVYECSEDRYAAKRLYNVIDKAMHMIDFDLGAQRFYKSIPAARKYFREAVDKIKTATPGGVILAGHSHLDIAWLWTTNEITRKCARTFANNLALMDNYPDFRFTQSQAAVYYFAKKYYPEVYERIKEKVKNGQWEITGNTWVEADTNIASGESLIRQLLYGREFFLKEFGVSSDIYWLPDCFGFTAALPQIIKRSGMKYFVTSKLQNNDTNEFPVSVYKWRSHSGDEVLAYMQKVGYGGEADAPYVVKARQSNRQNDIVDESLGMFGYGDGGGGCTYRMVERERRLEWLPGMPKVKMGAAKEFFAEVEKHADELPVWDGEMYYENHRGTYTSQAFIKKNNRRGEFMLRELEILSLLNDNYDKEKFDDLWRVLLTNQFHDILPGTSIHEAMEVTRKDYNEFFAATNKMYSKALRTASAKLAGTKDTVAVWNFLPFKVSNTVKLPVPVSVGSITDADGKALPCRIYMAEGVKILEFIAEDVPSMGYKLFYPCAANAPAVRTETDATLENEFIKVYFDDDMLISSIIDKTAGREVLAGKGNLLTVSHDKPIHESAWNLESDYKMNMTPLTGVESFRVFPFDGVKSRVHVTRRYNGSVIDQDIILKKGSRALEFRTCVDWHEREKVLKAEFPVDLRARYSTFEVAHGAVERPTYANNSYEKAMFECCAHKWTDLSESDYGVSLLNDCKYGYDIVGNVMRITLMRGPVCPDRKADIGKNYFTYSLYPHAGTWSDADTVHEAFKLNVPLKALYLNPVAEDSVQPAERSYIGVSAKDISLDALKPALNGDGAILRVYETERRHSRVKITLPGTVAGVTECNLMEQDERDVEVNINEFSFDIKPFEVKTFRIR